jgi:hypothetical protein
MKVRRQLLFKENYSCGGGELLLSMDDLDRNGFFDETIYCCSEKQAK